MKRPPARAHEKRSLASATVGTNGFSMYVWHPASSASLASAVWVWGGVTICTMSGRTDSSRGSSPGNTSVDGTISFIAATARGSGSATPTTVAWGESRAMPRAAWRCAILPPPTIATRMPRSLEHDAKTLALFNRHDLRNGAHGGRIGLLADGIACCNPKGRPLTLQHAAGCAGCRSTPTARAQGARRGVARLKRLRMPLGLGTQSGRRDGHFCH